MKKLVRRLLAGTLGVLAFSTLAVYGASEYRLRKTYDLPATFVADDSLPKPEAHRRAKSLMCLGCHQESGNVFFEAPLVGRVVAPNLTRIAPGYSDAELERLLRHGVKKDNTAALAMPSGTFSFLADEDISAIITWLRDLPAKPDSGQSKTSYGPLGRIALAANQLPFAADHIPKILSPLSRRPADLGRYLVAATCSDCHRLQRENNIEGTIVPPLAAVAQAYEPVEFAQLLRTGLGTGGRDLGLMTVVAKADFSNFTEAEVTAIHDYLRSDPQDEVNP